MAARVTGPYPPADLSSSGADVTLRQARPSLDVPLSIALTLHEPFHNYFLSVSYVKVTKSVRYTDKNVPFTNKIKTTAN